MSIDSPNPEASNPAKPADQPGMRIHIDRPYRMLAGIVFWLFLIAIGAFLAILLLRFTGSRVLAYGLAVGMLGYMILMASITGRNLTKPPGSGSLD